MMAENKKLTKESVKAFAKDWVETLKKRWWILLIEFAVLAIILVADLVSKEYVVKFLSTQSGMFYEAIPNFINFQYTENTGAGFGMFKGNTTALTVITLIVVIALMIFLILKLKENMWLRVSLIFIIGGGIGNIVDRVNLGYVRDFIQFDFWDSFAIFNVADSFVTVGAFMLIIVLIVMLVQEGRKNKKEFEEEQAKKIASGEIVEEIDPLDQPINLNPMLSSQNTYTFEQGEPKSNASEQNTANDGELSVDKNQSNKTSDFQVEDINVNSGETSNEDKTDNLND